MNQEPNSIFLSPPKLFKETSTVIRGTDIEGRSTVNQYIFVKKLGEGTYGKVKLAIRGENEDKYAIKIVRKTALKRKREMIRDEKGRIKFKDAFDNVLREIAIMKKIDHPNLIRLHEVIDGPDSDKMYIVLEYAAGGQVINWDEDANIFYNPRQKGYIEEEELRKIFRELIGALDYLHSNGIIHRDIKPQNVLLDWKGTIKLADFGVSTIVDGSDLLTKSEGTYHFMAPESIGKEGNGAGYSGKGADIWALGVTFYAITFYKMPFFSENLMELFELIENKPLEFPTERTVSNGLKDFLKRMLEKNPQKRPTLFELENHEWLLNGKEINEIVINMDPVSQSITQEEIQRAIMPFERVVFLRKLAQRVTNNTRRRLSPNPSGSSIQDPDKKMDDEDPVSIEDKLQKKLHVE